jgi:predicted ribosome quality control (RQC) complex YloA/Tae2 family protein
MSLNQQELSDIVAELGVVLKNAHLSKLNAPHALNDKACQLVFRSKPNRVVLIDLTVNQTRIHLIDNKLKAPQTSPGWVMKARRDLEGLMLSSIQQVNQDRIIAFEFSGTQHRPARKLVAELFGRRGRLLLLDQNDRLLYPAIGEATVGQLYQPATQPALDKASQRQSRFEGPDPKKLSTNQGVARFYALQVAEKQLTERRQQYLKSIRKEKKRLRQRIAKMEKDFQGTLVAEELAQQGEVLKVNLKNVQKGQTEVSLGFPWEPEKPPLTISLDPKLSPQDNMKRLFNKSRRLLKGRPQIKERIDAAKENLGHLAKIETSLEQADSIDQLDKIFVDGNLTGRIVIKKKQVKTPRLPFKIFVSATGKEILVGKSAKDNHQLTFRVARGFDLWLHAKDSPGAHVVVRLKRDQEIDEQSLLDAATLAAFYGGWKIGDKAEVTHTRAKNVHPIKGAPPGLVSVAQGRTFFVKIEEERLNRLTHM